MADQAPDAMELLDKPTAPQRSVYRDKPWHPTRNTQANSPAQFPTSSVLTDNVELSTNYYEGSNESIAREDLEIYQVNLEYLEQTSDHDTTDSGEHFEETFERGGTPFSRSTL